MLGLKRQGSEKADAIAIYEMDWWVIKLQSHTNVELARG
jgi:hypothetical protein